MVGVLVLMIAGCYSPEDSKETENSVPLSSSPGKVLFSGRCGSCHSLNIPLSKEYEREEWRNVITRMITKNGLSGLSSKDEKSIIDFLSSRSNLGSGSN
jgi:hypothetical protein